MQQSLPGLLAGPIGGEHGLCQRASGRTPWESIDLKDVRYYSQYPQLGCCNTSSPHTSEAERPGALFVGPQPFLWLLDQPGWLQITWLAPSPSPTLHWGQKGNQRHGDHQIDFEIQVIFGEHWTLVVWGHFWFCFLNPTCPPACSRWSTRLPLHKTDS